MNTSFRSHLLWSLIWHICMQSLFLFFSLSLFFFLLAPTLMSFWEQFYHRKLGCFGWRFGQLWCVCLMFFYNIHSCNHKDYKDFIFFWGGVSKIAADGDCSHEIKRCLLLGRKVTTNLDRILKSRDVTLPTKVYLVKTMVFPVVVYRCESWTIKKAEHQGIDVFELWC